MRRVEKSRVVSSQVELMGIGFEVDGRAEEWKSNEGGNKELKQTRDTNRKERKDKWIRTHRTNNRDQVHFYSMYSFVIPRTIISIEFSLSTIPFYPIIVC